MAAFLNLTINSAGRPSAEYHTPLSKIFSLEYLRKYSAKIEALIGRGEVLGMMQKTDTKNVVTLSL